MNYCGLDISSNVMHYKTQGAVNGVRRYQNKDGTLTEEGRRHYGIGPAREPKSNNLTSSQLKDSAKILNESGKSLNSAANFIKNSKVYSESLDTSALSTDEMKKIMDRRRTEISYNEMFNASAQKKQRRKEATANVINGVATGLGIAASALTIAMLVKNVKNPESKKGD